MGLLLSGIGGGSFELPLPLPPLKSFFFGGGGGGAFFPNPPWLLATGDSTADAGGGGDALDDARLLTLAAIPYFWLSELADFHPDATCSPCRCWKLFAVDAAPFRSEADTLEGSLRKLLAVRSAACLSAHDVPIAGGSAGDFGPDNLANLLCSSLICDP